MWTPMTLQPQGKVLGHLKQNLTPSPCAQHTPLLSQATQDKKCMQPYVGSQPACRVSPGTG